MQVITATRDIELRGNGYSITPYGYAATFDSITPDSLTLDRDAISGIRPGVPVFASPDAYPAGVIYRVDQDACGIQIGVRLVGDFRTRDAVSMLMRLHKVTRFVIGLDVLASRVLSPDDIHQRFGRFGRWVVQMHPRVTLVERCALRMIGLHIPAGVTIPQASSRQGFARPVLVEDAMNTSGQPFSWLLDD